MLSIGFQAVDEAVCVTSDRDGLAVESAFGIELVEECLISFQRVYIRKE